MPIEPIRIIIEITPQEKTNFTWELKSSYSFNQMVLIEALQKIILKLHWDHVVEELKEEEDNQSDD